ncbi:MAG: hypothetical protein H6735_06865 [Alphaproteobacteria bacterium]|nr:hypothetical protein [Alphaproteobacteria bacterium]
MLLLALASTAPSHAAEVQFEGFYRGRLRAFDTLSLARDLANSEGFAMYGEHRLWLRPRFLVTDAVALNVDFRGLDGVKYGDQPAYYQTYTTPAPTVFELGLEAPTSDTDERAPLLDFTVWRAWGEVDIGTGRLSFGRMPMHWGSGIWLNDGVSLDRDFANYGDTTDRVAFDALIRDEFFVRVGVDVPAERFVNQEDDTEAIDLSVAYRSEDITAGILARYDHSGTRDQNVGPLNVFTLDGSGELYLGKLHAAAEVVGQFGGGDLDSGANDVSITTFGAALDADLDLGPFVAAVRAGLATGDADPNDLNLKTFTFDRDYSLGMFLFEQPMPTLATTAAAANDTNGGRDYSEALSGEAIGNALFLRPTISREIVDGFTVWGSWAGARTARAQKINNTNQSRSYGNEFQLGAGYTGIEHFSATLRLGAFLPGSVYSVSADGVTPSSFTEAAYGGQLGLRVEF